MRDCEECGEGFLEFFDTISETGTEIHVELKCTECGHITDEWQDKDETYFYSESFM
jgi:uncharacterized Zn finger protein